MNRTVRVGVVVTVLLTAVFVLPTPAFAAMNLQRVEAWSSYDGTDGKVAVAHCPANTRVLGGGADLSGGGFDVHITGMHPDEAGTAFIAVGREHSPTDGPWRVIAHAVCAPKPIGYHIVDKTIGGDSSYSNIDEAFCDAGEKVLGVGARVVSTNTSKLFLTIVKPTVTGNGTEAAAVEMTGGYSGNWQLRIWAICVVPVLGWQQIIATEGDGVSYAAMSCPDEKQLTGAGAYISLSLGVMFFREVGALDHINDSRPVDTTSAAVGWVGGFPDHDWRLKAYGICVD